MRFEDLPPVGYGCSPVHRGAFVELEGSIETAVSTGYRLFDTAEIYGSERLLGRILNGPNGVRREEIYIVSKLWNTNHAAAHVADAAEDSLKRLGLEYLDLYLIHSPESWRHDAPLGELGELAAEQIQRRAIPRNNDGTVATIDIPLAETWTAVQALQRRGLTRAIGVSNFEESHLSELLDLGGVSPLVNQVHCGPYRPREALVEYCRRNGVGVMAHSPFAAQSLLDEPVLRSIGSRYGKSPAQALLRWYVDRGFVPLPSTTNRRHLAENLDLLDFKLSPIDLAEIQGLRRLGN